MSELKLKMQRSSHLFLSGVSSAAVCLLDYYCEKSLSLTCVRVCLCVCAYVYCRLDVIQNAWTGEVVPLPQDRTLVPDDSSEVPPSGESNLATREDYFRQYRWTLSS